jgi:hypothetical protein
MKKIAFLGSIVVVIAMISFAFTANVSKNKPQSTTGTPIPEDLMKIFKTSCMDCHADGGSKMACMHVNFSEWDKLPAEKQASKAEAICKMLTKDAMPPKSYKTKNPTKVPTKDQVKLICDWSNKLNPQK